jgi:hypothetical protein
MIKALEKPTRQLPSLQHLIDGTAYVWQKLQGVPEPESRRHLSAFQQAVERAYRRFAELHPRWANSLFDEYFLTRHAAPILSSIHRRGRWPTAYELSLAWFAQFESCMGENTYDRICAAMPIAVTFLDLLQEEWIDKPTCWSCAVHPTP